MMFIPQLFCAVMLQEEKISGNVWSMFWPEKLPKHLNGGSEAFMLKFKKANHIIIVEYCV